MVAAPPVAFLDSGLFVIDLRYPRDRNFRTNRRALERIRGEGTGITSAWNLLEVCGILSFDLDAHQTRGLIGALPGRYGVRVVPDDDPNGLLPALPVPLVMERLARRMALGDALVAIALDQFAPEATHFVTWNAEHFRGKVLPEVVTPGEYLKLG